MVLLTFSLPHWFLCYFLCYFMPSPGLLYCACSFYHSLFYAIQSCPFPCHSLCGAYSCAMLSPLPFSLPCYFLAIPSVVLLSYCCLCQTIPLTLLSTMLLLCSLCHSYSLVIPSTVLLPLPCYPPCHSLHCAILFAIPSAILFPCMSLYYAISIPSAMFIYFVTSCNLPLSLLYHSLCCDILLPFLALLFSLPIPLPSFCHSFYCAIPFCHFLCFVISLAILSAPLFSLSCYLSFLFPCAISIICSILFSCHTIIPCNTIPPAVLFPANWCFLSLSHSLFSPLTVPFHAICCSTILFSP